MSAQATSLGLAPPTPSRPTREAFAPFTNANTHASGGMAPTHESGWGAPGSTTAAQSDSKSRAAWATSAFNRSAGSWRSTR